MESEILRKHLAEHSVTLTHNSPVKWFVVWNASAEAWRSKQRVFTKSIDEATRYMKSEVSHLCDVHDNDVAIPIECIMHSVVEGS